MRSRPLTAGIELGPVEIDMAIACYGYETVRYSMLDIQSGSDAFGGKTDITGREFIAKFGLNKHV